MKKVFCDACNSQVTGRVYRFEPLCHIGEHPMHGYAYIERDDDGKAVDFIPTSGRTDAYDLCNKCYNAVYGAAFEKFKELGGIKK